MFVKYNLIEVNLDSFLKSKQIWKAVALTQPTTLRGLLDSSWFTTSLSKLPAKDSQEVHRHRVSAIFKRSMHA